MPVPRSIVPASFGENVRLTLTLALLLAGCPDTKYGSGDSSTLTGTDPTDTNTETITDTNTTPTQPTGDCNPENEDCGPGSCGGEGVNMLPGADCLSCHSRGSGEEEADPWSVGGTLFSDILGTNGVEGAVVRVTDSTGKTVTLETSRVGNFYSEDRLTPPLTAEVETDGVVREMSQEVETGACNSCHSCEGAAHGKMYK